MTKQQIIDGLLKRIQDLEKDKYKYEKFIKEFVEKQKRQKEFAEDLLTRRPTNPTWFEHYINIKETIIKEIEPILN